MLLLLLGLIPVVVWLRPVHASAVSPSVAAAELDASNLAQATNAIEAQALATGALSHPPQTWSPASAMLRSLDALTGLALRNDPNRVPQRTTGVMGPVPTTLAHPLKQPPPHRHVSATHLLRPFTHALPDVGSVGIGHDRTHDGAKPASFQDPDGILVDPVLQRVRHNTIGMVALRSALQNLGQPYVWGGAGPSTFDCSGLVQWAYAHAGVWLTHYTGDQWNEARRIPAHDILPGDLVLFGRTLHHVGIYLAAGWMLNAPYTGQYVNVVPVPGHVAGVVRP
jgi:cell wall-associated NlpC family hydrolase